MGPPWTGKGRFACWNCFLLGDFFEGIVLVPWEINHQFFMVWEIYIRTYLEPFDDPCFACKLGPCFGGFNPKNRG